MIKKTLKERKALSPVLANILLLLIILTLMVGLWTYSQTYVENYQDRQAGPLLERLVIEDALFTDSDQIKLTLYNYGKLKIKITDIYVNRKPYSFDPDPLEIAVRESKDLTINILYAAGNSYSLKIITERGYDYEGEIIAPYTLS